MVRETLISRLLRVGFAPKPTGWQLFIATINRFLFTVIILAIILLSTTGTYDPLQVALACLIYFTYALISLALQNRFYSQHKARRFWRGVIEVALIVLGLQVFAHARGPLWLLLVIPLWRLLEADPIRPWGIVLIGLATSFGIFRQTSIEVGDAGSAAVASLTFLKVLWLGLVMAIIYGYIELVNRSREAAAAKRQFAQNLAQQMFQAHTLEKWCQIVLTETLKITEASYATFQIVNNRTGSLDLVAALKKEASDLIEIDPAKVDAPASFSDLESAGLTGHVARTGETVAIPSVSQDIRYIPFFPDVTTEIAVPIHDLLNNNIGGVLNVEFTKDSAPKSPTFPGYRKTLEEIAEQLRPAYSFVLLSNLRNNLRQIGLQVDSGVDENKIASMVVEGLYRQYHCPIGLWLVDGREESRIKLEVARAYPPAYGRSRTRVSSTGSLLGHFLQSETYAKQLIRLSSETVDNWKAIRAMEKPPATMVLVPLIGIEARLGVLQLFTYRQSLLPDYELEMLTDLGRQSAIAIEKLRQQYSDRVEMLKHEATAIAHDLGSSLNHLDSMLTNLFSVLKIESPIISHANNATESELKYIRDIVDLLNMRTGGASAIPLDEYNVHELIERAESLLLHRGELAVGQLTIKRIAPEAEVVYCNRPIAVGTLFNLFRNAIQAPGGHLSIEITASVDTLRRHVNIDVRNYGRPLTSNEKEHLFELGFSTKKSLGVGLKTYGALMGRIGGSLHFLESTEQRGTVFRIQLKRPGGAND